MELKRKNYCPLLKKECANIKCGWFIKVSGYDINTGRHVDEWDCVVSALPKILIQNAGMQRQTTAAFDSFKHEMEQFATQATTFINPRGTQKDE